MGASVSTNNGEKYRFMRKKKSSKVDSTCGLETVDPPYEEAPPLESAQVLSSNETVKDSALEISFEHHISSPAGSLGSASSSKRFAFSGAGISANDTFPSSISNEESTVIDSPHRFIPLRRTGSDANEQFTSLLNPKPGPVRRLQSYKSAPTALLDAILNSGSVHLAGGPVGEDRVQAVCSEEDGWLYCGIYDGFNGRDAADYVAANLYKTIADKVKLLELTDNSVMVEFDTENGQDSDSFQTSLVNCLKESLQRTETGFFQMVENEMRIRPELPMIGCCLVSVLLHGDDLYTINLGDSKAVLATMREGNLHAIQLTCEHSLANIEERDRLESEHPGEEVIKNKRVKGKVKVTKAFGAGFLKKAQFNESLPSIFRVKPFQSPPYLSSDPFVSSRKIAKEDQFVIIGSDGLFEFFSNDELVRIVASHQKTNPGSDPSKFLVSEIVHRAAKKASMSVDTLKSIPSGDRRKYHDDVTVVVVSLEDKIHHSSSTRS